MKEKNFDQFLFTLMYTVTIAVDFVVCMFNSYTLWNFEIILKIANGNNFKRPNYKQTFVLIWQTEEARTS